MRWFCRLYIWLLEHLYTLLLWAGTLTTVIAGFLLLYPALGLFLSLLAAIVLALPVFNLWNRFASVVDFYLPLWLPMPENYRVYRLVVGLTRVSSYIFLDYIFRPSQVRRHLERWSQMPASSWARRAFELLSDYIDYKADNLKEFYWDERERVDRFLNELGEALGLR
ncbi:MAG: hypothetical protein QXI60_05140 [Thermofilaceae archaeon]